MFKISLIAIEKRIAEETADRYICVAFERLAFLRHILEAPSSQMSPRDQLPLLKISAFD